MTQFEKLLTLLGIICLSDTKLPFKFVKFTYPYGFCYIEACIIIESRGNLVGNNIVWPLNMNYNKIDE